LYSWVGLRQHVLATVGVIRAENEARSVYRPILTGCASGSSVTPRKKSIVVHPVASPSTKVSVPGIASPNVMRPTPADPEASKVATVTCSTGPR
jgi:hypothetical protein